MPRDTDEIAGGAAGGSVLSCVLPQDRQERFLNNVVRDVRSAHIRGVPEDLSLVTAEQLRECRLVADSRPCEQARIVHLNNAVPDGRAKVPGNVEAGPSGVQQQKIM